MKALFRRLLEKTEEYLKSKSRSPHRVPLKMLGTIVQNAAMEEDDSLQAMWAALLADSATTEEEPQPMLVEILRQLSPADALLMRKCFREVMAAPIDRPGGFQSVQNTVREWATVLTQLHAKPSYPYSPLSLENLRRLGLLSTSGILINGVGDTHVTKIGLRFMYACENPAEIKRAEEELFKNPRIKRATTAPQR
jgi:hypothetical protein